MSKYMPRILDTSGCVLSSGDFALPIGVLLVWPILLAAFGKNLLFNSDTNSWVKLKSGSVI